MSHQEPSSPRKREHPVSPLHQSSVPSTVPTAEILSEQPNRKQRRTESSARGTDNHTTTNSSSSLPHSTAEAAASAHHCVPSSVSAASAKEARFEGRRMPEAFHELLYAARLPENRVSASDTSAERSANEKYCEDHAEKERSDAVVEDAAIATGGYAQPDEAPDVEELVKGHEDYSDLPPERRAALRKSVQQLCERVLEGHRRGQPPTPAKMEHLCVRASRLHGFQNTARKSELTAAYRELVREGVVREQEEVEQVLVRKRGKSHSGVLVITVLMGPGAFSCPKDCHYCPNQPGVARSYLLKEPAVLRGFRNGWDPIAQFYDRASALEGNGHVVDKIELIILGGTFSFYPAQYAEEFIGACFYAANTYYASPSSGKVIDPFLVKEEEEESPVPLEGCAAATATLSSGGVGLRPMGDIQSEIRWNERARCRIIGVTIETRPDYINRRELQRFRRMGVTRVQLGIQHLDDEILRLINRDCPTVKAAAAIGRLLDAGFKVDAHWMPDLPGSSYEKDLEMFQTLLDDELNENFQVDQWKVYPTATVPYTRISEWYEAGTYKPYAERDGGEWMAKLLLYIVTHAPYRLRLNRIVRDIPTTYIKGGERRVNLRQLLEAQMKREGLRCKDIRERECKHAEVRAEELTFFADSHRASGGTEYYLSMENASRTQLYGHLRLRIRDDCNASERNILAVLRGAALIRELHTYGTLVAVRTGNSGESADGSHHTENFPTGVAGSDEWERVTATRESRGSTTTTTTSHSTVPAPHTAQHRGIGARLMREAEKLALETHQLRKCVVIAGVGARAYYAKLGYHLEETYMVKDLGVPSEKGAEESRTREETSTESQNFFQRLRSWLPF